MNDKLYTGAVNTGFYCNSFAPFLWHHFLWNYISQPNIRPFHRAWILNCSSHNMHRSHRSSSSSYSKDRWARQHWRRSFVPVTQSHFFARSNLNGVRYVICFKSSSPKWQPLSQPSLFPKFQPCPTGQKWQQAWVTSTKRKGMWRVYVNHYQLLGKSACLVQGWKKS